jgi:bifunctional non-homologous end joining protein LigD
VIAPSSSARRGNYFEERIPAIAGALQELPEVVLDGELVVLDVEGRPLCDKLTRRSRLKKKISIEHAARTTPAVLFVFDLLELDGEDMGNAHSSSARGGFKQL